jgi:hypothetical protein
VKRIGWVAPGPLPLGSSTTGFGFLVLASGASSGATNTLLNLGQVFGQSLGDPTNLPVFDNSGDQYPANFSAGNGTPGSSVPLGTQPGSGYPPASGPNDPGGNTGPAGGANNVVTLTPQTALLNGPAGAPAAVGPDGTTTTDLTIQSVTVPTGLPPSSGLPTALQSVFTNTIGNTGTVPLMNVTVVPQPPATPGALPDGTTAAITYPGNATPAVYTYTAAGGWVLTSGPPIAIPSVAAGATQNYTVTITLPAGTAQSTNGGAAANGFAVPILASSTTAYGTSSNVTTDTVYTGFVKLTKLAQVFNADGSPCDSAPTISPNPACVIPGNFVTYTITYANIIAPALGSGSVGPSAKSFTITECGYQSTQPTQPCGVSNNTWASLVNGVLATSAVQGSATDSTAGNTITFYNSVGQNVGDIVGTGTPTGDVAVYVDKFPAPLAPGASGTFVFQRKIN